VNPHGGGVTKGRRAIFLDHGGGLVAGQSALRRDKPERWRCDQGATIRILGCWGGVLADKLALPRVNPRGAVSPFRVSLI
jgi:hypothetical protein